MSSAIKITGCKDITLIGNKAWGFSHLADVSSSKNVIAVDNIAFSNQEAPLDVVLAVLSAKSAGDEKQQFLRFLDDLKTAKGGAERRSKLDAALHWCGNTLSAAVSDVVAAYLKNAFSAMES
ncbi:MAG TPA: hypothetical protein VNZ61_17200 [Roseomonas sp.]|nr:hypothetical protein [Roseomonas sp.]